MKRLADAAFDAFGNVHILCNNAGVGGGIGNQELWNLPLDSARNRPEGLKAEQPPLSREMLARLSVIRGFLKEGFSPEEIAARVVDAIREDVFYVVAAQPNVDAAVDLRLEDLRRRRNPTILNPS